MITNEAICTFTPHSTDTLEADTVKNKLSRVKKNDDFDEKDFSRNFFDDFESFDDAKQRKALHNKRNS